MVMALAKDLGNNQATCESIEVLTRAETRGYGENMPVRQVL